MFVFQITWVIFHSISPKLMSSPLNLKLLTVLLVFLNNSSSYSSPFIFLSDFFNLSCYYFTSHYSLLIVLCFSFLMVFFVFIFIFDWKIIALQYFVGFCHTGTRISLLIFLKVYKAEYYTLKQGINSNVIFNKIQTGY